MGLELDTLDRQRPEVTLIYCNTTGRMASFGSFDHFKKVLKETFGVEEGGIDDIKDYFGRDELEEFFDEHDITITTAQLDSIFGKAEADKEDEDEPDK